MAINKPLQWVLHTNVAYLGKRATASMGGASIAQGDIPMSGEIGRIVGEGEAEDF